VKKVALVTVTIDGLAVQVPAGTSVLDAAKSIGIQIPALCCDPDLSPAGACRLCVVEIDGMRNLPASCVTWVAPGMVVRTNAPAVIEARKTILELLIANHPLDCLTCEKLGECKLAEYCYLYGIKGSPLKGEKHSYDLEDDNPYIVRDLNKCILCGKCIRACAEITGRNILDFVYRGFSTKVTPFGDVPYSDSDCIFCGNCVSFCPVGALTEKQMRGQGRRFELKKVRTTCTFCGAGCNFNLCVKDGKVVGVLSSPDSPVNGNALCIRGRFATKDFIHSDRRLTKPLIRKDGQLVPASWDEALDLVGTAQGDQRRSRAGFLCRGKFGPDHQRGELPGAEIHQSGDGYQQRGLLCPHLPRRQRLRGSHL
jgi:formate dehydrogenase alpha subunit